jgi:acetyl-CoA carboxylase biotin carboxyl carrier protein
MEKKMDVAEIERLVEILGKSDITEFELKDEGWRLSLTRTPRTNNREGSNQQTQPDEATFHSYSSFSSSGDSPQLSSKSEVPVRNDLIKVESPIVGTFYRKPSPDSSAFVADGDTVKKGQTLCIVEAMKLMNEIPSPSDGKIHTTLLTDGQVVEFGEVMYLLEPI